MLQEVRAFHKRYFSLEVNNYDFIEPEQTKNKWFVIESLVVTVPKTSGENWVDISGKRDHQVYTSSLQLPSIGFRSIERNRTSATRTRLWKRFSSPEEHKLVGGRRKNIKNDDDHS